MATKKTVTPDADLKEFNEFSFQNEMFRVKRAFKIGRFLKTLNTSPVDAIEFALEEESYEKFLDLEMTMDDLKEFLELLSNVMSGSTLKN